MKYPLGLSATEAFAFAHCYGGFISVNNYFGGKQGMAARRVEKLIPQRAFGADLLECNRGQRRDFFRLGALSAAGLPMTGNGVSASHTSIGGWHR